MSINIFHTILKSILFSLLSILFFQKSSALESQLENGNNLNLFGIGLHQEKRNNIYVGALFAPEYITDPNQLLAVSADKRMSLKFVSKYSNRQMARFWKQRIAMNNPKSTWQPLTKEIVQFANIFKQPMQAGDEINIDFNLDTGTSVYLNKTLFLTIDNLQFYELLLNIWIGSIPPSEAFKIGITGKNNTNTNEQLIAQYQSIQPVVGRFKREEKAVTQVAAVAATKPETTEKTVPKSTPSKKKTVSAAKSTKNNTKKAPLPKIDSVKPAVITPNKLVTEALSKPITQTKVAQKNTTKNAPKEKRTETKKILVPEKTNEKIAKLDIPEEPFFDADLLSGAYTLELINAIRKYQSYPRKALTAGDQGDVVVQLKINAKGEILDSNIIKRSGSRILDRAVLRMVKKAEPYPEIPKELNLEEYEFEVPMSFHLSD